MTREIKFFQLVALTTAAAVVIAVTQDLHIDDRANPAAEPAIRAVF